MTDALRSYQLNGRWFAVDNDSYYMGTDIANVSEIAGGWPVVRTWMSMVGLSCGAALTADPWHWESFRSHWRNVEVMTPPARERTAGLRPAAATSAEAAWKVRNGRRARGRGLGLGLDGARPGRHAGSDRHAQAARAARERADGGRKALTDSISFGSLRR